MIFRSAPAACRPRTQLLLQTPLLPVSDTKTSIVIAHRQNSERHYEALYILDNGGLLAAYSYDEPMARSEEFLHLTSMPVLPGHTLPSPLGAGSEA